MESDYEIKLDAFVRYVIKHKPDVIALQEIMQPISSQTSNYAHTNVGEILLKEGNHALNIVKKLRQNGENYYLYWLGIKKSYDKFDEGLVILTREKAEKTDAVLLSPFDDYNNWKTRKALGVKIKGAWYYSVHMGWWGDKESSFEYEFNSLKKSLPKNEKLWLMGDFNSIASERDKGYDLVIKSGFFDTYCLAVNKDSGITAHTQIDGWKSEEKSAEIRIDYIFTNYQEEIDSSFTVFNGKNERVVSDHFGIIVTTGKEQK